MGVGEKGVKFGNAGGCGDGHCNSGTCNRSNHMYNNIDMKRMGFWDVLVDGDRSNSGVCAGMQSLGDAISKALGSVEVPGGDDKVEHNGVSAEVDVQADGGGAGTSIADDVEEHAGDKHNTMMGDAVDGLDGGNCGEVSIGKVSHIVSSIEHAVRKQASDKTEELLNHLQKGVRGNVGRWRKRTMMDDGAAGNVGVAGGSNRRNDKCNDNGQISNEDNGKR